MPVAIEKVISISAVCGPNALQFNPMRLSPIKSDSGFRFRKLWSHRLPQLHSSHSSHGRTLAPTFSNSNSSSSSSSRVEIVRADKQLQSLPTVAESFYMSMNPWLLSKHVAFLATVGLTFVSGAAIAEEIVTDPSAVNQEVAADKLLIVLFVAAFIGLSVLTVGVIYLSVTEFMESRERNAMAKASGEQKQSEGSIKERFAPKGFGVKKVDPVAAKKSEKEKENR